MVYFIYLDIMCFVNLKTQIASLGENVDWSVSPIYGPEEVEKAQFWMEFVLYEVLAIVNLFLLPLTYLVYI